MIETETSGNKNLATGEIEIAQEVIEVIAHISTNEVSGVDALKSDFSSGMKTLFGRDSYNNGVDLSSDDEGLKVDIYCNFNYGVSVPKVAMEIQNSVREQVFHMTDIVLSEVNVHVVAIVPEKEENKKVFNFESEEDDV